MNKRIRIGIVGAGQIARVQHIPAIKASLGFQLAAIVDPFPVVVSPGVQQFSTIRQLIDARLVDAVAICTPPQVRYEIAREALDAGLHVLVEKPPAQTVSEVDELTNRARRKGLTVFTAWHSLFSGAIGHARDILAKRGFSSMSIEWREDVEKFHPGVDWFWKPGGMGVFDAFINALSIVTDVMPEPVFVRTANFQVPEGAHTPISATIEFATPSLASGLRAELDWRHKGDEIWSIKWTLRDGGVLEIHRGGELLIFNGETLVNYSDDEYPAIYRHFCSLISRGQSDVETRPLQLTADAFSVARIERVETVELLRA